MLYQNLFYGRPESHESLSPEPRFTAIDPISKTRQACKPFRSDPFAAVTTVKKALLYDSIVMRYIQHYSFH